MLMGQSELKNTLALTKLRLRRSKAMFLILAGIATLFTVFQIFTVITDVSNNEISFDFRELTLLSGTPILIFLICYLIGSYSESNKVFEVYPQTNTSRLISSQIVIYLTAIGYFLLTTIWYGLSVLVYTIFMGSTGELVFAYTLDWKYFIIGLLVNLSIWFIIIALLTFLQLIFRKFMITTVVLAICAALSFIIFRERFVHVMESIIGFLTNEQSLVLFFIKALLIWLAIIGISFWINKKTIYYQTERRLLKNPFILLSFALFVFFGFIFFSMESNETIHEETIHEEVTSVPFNESKRTIELDASALQDQRVLKVKRNGFDDIASIDQDIVSGYLSDLYFVNNAPEGKIIIEYTLPHQYIRGIAVLTASDQSFKAEIKNGQLELNYQLIRKKGTQIYFKPWPFTDKFTAFQNRDFFKISDFSGGGSMIEIRLPKGLEAPKQD